MAHYLRSCLVCQWMKSDSQKNGGALQPIPLPKRTWQQIITDLVTNLHEPEGKTTAVVFADRLTKMVHFFPCTKEITATEYAHLFVNQVFRLHGMLEVIILDRDPRFTSKSARRCSLFSGRISSSILPFIRRQMASLRSPSVCWRIFAALH